MVKQFTYYGLTVEELEKLPSDKLFKLLTARARRSLKRGINDGKRKLIDEIKDAKAGNHKNTIKTHLRDLIILPYMVGVTVNVLCAEAVQSRGFYLETSNGLPSMAKSTSTPRPGPVGAEPIPFMERG